MGLSSSKLFQVKFIDIAVNYKINSEEMKRMVHNGSKVNYRKQSFNGTDNIVKDYSNYELKIKIFYSSSRD